MKNLLGDWSIKNAKIANFVYHEKLDEFKRLSATNQPISIRS